MGAWTTRTNTTIKKNHNLKKKRVKTLHDHDQRGEETRTYISIVILIRDICRIHEMKKDTGSRSREHDNRLANFGGAAIAKDFFIKSRHRTSSLQ
jgi:hypothetical protein